jgi:hypothetical protein
MAVDISDYALIDDCQTAALISQKEASIGCVGPASIPTLLGSLAGR